MAIKNRSGAENPNLDQIAWAEHALEYFDVRRAEGVEVPELSESLVEEASVIGGIPHGILATMGLRAISRTKGEFRLLEISTDNGGQDG